MIHPTANLWGTAIRLPDDVKIGAFCDIGNADIGERTKIQCHVSIPPGWTIGDEVFIGPGVRFANDKKPKIGRHWMPSRGYVENGASIGMGALIGAGITIGKDAVIGMGAVVLKDVPAGEVWVGNPAHPISGAK